MCHRVTTQFRTHPMPANAHMRRRSARFRLIQQLQPMILKVARQQHGVLSSRLSLITTIRRIQLQCRTQRSQYPDEVERRAPESEVRGRLIMISQTVEYALRAIVTIAQHEGQPCTAKKLAEITQVPLLYLSKLIQGLVRGSLVTSQRGLHGGLLRTRSPSELTILDVFNVVEPIKRITQCPLRIQSHGTNLCPLHRRLDAAIVATEKIFQETTLAEMQSQPGSVTPLCEEKKSFSLGDRCNFLGQNKIENKDCGSRF